MIHNRVMVAAQWPDTSLRDGALAALTFIEGKRLTPCSANQSRYTELLHDRHVDVVVALGQPGVGKTELAVQAALDSLLAGRHRCILLHILLHIVLHILL